MIKIDGVVINDQWQEFLLEVPSPDGSTIGYLEVDDAIEARNLKNMGSTVRYRTIFASELLDF